MTDLATPQSTKKAKDGTKNHKRTRTQTDSDLLESNARFAEQGVCKRELNVIGGVSLEGRLHNEME